MLPPSWKGEVEKVVEDKANARSERQKTEDDKNAITTAIQTFIHTYNAQHNKPERKDKVKRVLDIATVILLFGTALFTALAWLVFKGQLHVFEKQLAEMQKVYGPIKGSADAAKAQSEANRDQVAILKNQLRANLKVRIERATINQDSKPVVWIFTPVWTNAGGTDAVQATGWDDIEFFDSEISDSFDFLTARHPSGQTISVPQGDEFMQQTKSLSAEQIQKIIDQKGSAIIWGYMEYGDVFLKSPRHHIHYCLRVFPANIGTLISFPLYKPECNSRD